MHKPKIHNAPVSLAGLNQKLDFEIKRLVREQEEGIVKNVSKTAVLNGTSTLVFKKVNGEKVTLSYRLDAGGALRFAREKQFTDPSPAGNRAPIAPVGRSSRNI